MIVSLPYIHRDEVSIAQLRISPNMNEREVEVIMDESLRIDSEPHGACAHAIMPRCHAGSFPYNIRGTLSGVFPLR